jgi:DNA-binding protein YbaB
MSDYNDRLDAEIERADRRIRETGERVAEHLGRTGPVTGRATSPDGAVTVVVGAGGRLLEVRIDNSALMQKPEQLAAQLVNLAGRATKDAGGRLHQSMRRVVSPEVANSLAQLGIPPPADEEVDWAAVIRRAR